MLAAESVSKLLSKVSRLESVSAPEEDIINQHEKDEEEAEEEESPEEDKINTRINCI